MVSGLLAVAAPSAEHTQAVAASWTAAIQRADEAALTPTLASDVVLYRENSQEVVEGAHEVAAYFLGRRPVVELLTSGPASAPGYAVVESGITRSTPVGEVGPIVRVYVLRVRADAINEIWEFGYAGSNAAASGRNFSVNTWIAQELARTGGDASAAPQLAIDWLESLTAGNYDAWATLVTDDARWKGVPRITLIQDAAFLTDRGTPREFELRRQFVAGPRFYTIGTSAGGRPNLYGFEFEGDRIALVGWWMSANLSLQIR